MLIYYILRLKNYVYNISHTDTLLLPDDARWISCEILYIYRFLVLK